MSSGHITRSKKRAIESIRNTVETSLQDKELDDLAIRKALLEIEKLELIIREQVIKMKRMQFDLYKNVMKIVVEGDYDASLVQEIKRACYRLLD